MMPSPHLSRYLRLRPGARPDREPKELRRRPAARFLGRLLALVLCPLLVLGLLFLAGCGEGFVAESTSSESTTSSATSESTTTSSTEPPFVLAEGEIYLEPVGTAGPEPFAGETFVPVGPTSTLSIPTPAITLPAPPSTTVGSGTAQVASFPGDTPALYGGSKSKARCDKEGQLRFLEQNPPKANAFCAALNNDSSFRWSGGSLIRPEQLRDYFAELTPVMLTRDTRVTNHGYRDGKPTPRQSVLQAGQAVLVDIFGIPRVRCECGNPLAPPVPVPTKPTYTGPRWPGFDPTVIIVIQQTTVIIETLILIDVYTGDVFERPVGTIGGQDAAREIAVDALELNGHWEGTLTFTDITIDEDAVAEGSEEGCDLAFLALLEEELLNQPLPLYIDVSIDQSGNGTAVVLYDLSSLDLGEDIDTSESEPMTVPVTYTDGTLTFHLEESGDTTGNMVGTVTRQGNMLVMDGTLGSYGPGFSMFGVWMASK